MNSNTMSGNPTRLALADILKGVAVILMIQVHLTELFATEEVFESLTGRISLFLGGPSAAPVFMVVMGFFFAQSRKSTAQHLMRGLQLIGLGFLLNFGMNAHLLIKIIGGKFDLDPWPYIFGVDILFLAGLSIMIMVVFKAIFRFHLLAWIILMFLAASVNAYLPVYTGEHAWIKYLQAYFWGYFSWSYFPVFPWLAYPVLGVVVSVLHEKFGMLSIKPVYQLVVALLMFIPVLLFFPVNFRITTQLHLYYHHTFQYFLWAVAFMALWAALNNLLVNAGKNSAGAIYLKFIGKNVTAAYIIQWLMIGNLATAVYRTKALPELAVWFAIILLATSMLTAAYTRLAPDGRKLP